MIELHIEEAKALYHICPHMATILKYTLKMDKLNEKVILQIRLFFSQVSKIILL